MFWVCAKVVILLRRLIFGRWVLHSLARGREAWGHFSKGVWVVFWHSPVSQNSHTSISYIDSATWICYNCAYDWPHIIKRMELVNTPLLQIRSVFKFLSTIPVKKSFHLPLHLASTVLFWSCSNFQSYMWLVSDHKNEEPCKCLNAANKERFYVALYHTCYFTYPHILHQLCYFEVVPIVQVTGLTS